MIANITSLPRAVTDIDFANSKDLCCVACGDGCIRLIQIIEEQEFHGNIDDQ